MRNISEEIEEFLDRYFKDIIDRVNNDNELALCFRKNIIEVYYQGINLLRIRKVRSNFKYEISSGIFKLSTTSLNNISKEPIVDSYINEMISIRNQFQSNGWVLEWNVTSDKWLNNNLFQNFCLKEGINNNYLINEQIDNLIEYIYSSNETDKSSVKKNNYNIKFSNNSNSSPDRILEFWLKHLNDLKRVVDIYFITTSVYKEKIFQNYLFRNYIDSDITPIDIEYNVPSESNSNRKGRPDIIGLSDSSISLIEVKYNANSLVGAAGVIEHTKDFIELVYGDSKKQLEEMIEDIIEINKLRKKFRIKPYMQNTKNLIKITYEIIFGIDNVSKYLNKIREMVKSFNDLVITLPKKIQINNQVVRVEFVSSIIGCNYNKANKIIELNNFGKNSIFYQIDRG